MIAEIKVWLAWFRLTLTAYRLRNQRRRLYRLYMTMDADLTLMCAINSILNQK